MRALSAFLLCATLAACSKKAASDQPPLPVLPPGVVAPVMPPRSPEADVPLFDRLTREATQKNKSDPSTQQVLDALVKAGLPVAELEQRMGAGIGARYCSRVLAERLAIIVCEYSDPSAAEAGAAGSRKAFAAVAGQTLDVKRSTSLTIVDSYADQASGEAVKRARAAFNAL